MMKKFGSFCLLFFLFFINASAQQKQMMENLENRIREKFKSEEGTFALAFKNLNGPESLFINDDTVFHAASTMKLPVMIEVFRQAAAGEFSLNDSVEVKNEFKSIADGSSFSLHAEDDGETDLYNHTGEKMTIYELMYRMIIRSSNLATNIIIEKVGAENVMRTIRREGARKMKVLRGVEDEKAFEAEMNNVTTAYDLLRLLVKIGRNEMVNPTASDIMMKILLDQQFNDVIPALLPAGVRVAHKTGNITGVEHDAGIVLLPDGRRYVLVLLSKGVNDLPAAKEMMSEVSLMVYNFVMQHQYTDKMNFTLR